LSGSCLLARGCIVKQHDGGTGPREERFNKEGGCRTHVRIERAIPGGAELAVHEALRIGVSKCELCLPNDRLLSLWRQPHHKVPSRGTEVN